MSKIKLELFDLELLN